MENENEDKFRKLIQRASLDEPGTAFTKAIMKQVEAASELDLAKEAALVQLLQSHTFVETPSANFSRRVMNQVTVRQSRSLEPIISPRVWYMIAASLLCLVLSYLLLLPSGSSQPASSGLDRLLLGFEDTMDSLPVSYPLTIFAMSVLIVADYLVRQSRRLSIR